MSDSGPIPGWGADRASAVTDPATRSISARLSEAWGVYRANALPLVAAATLFYGILGLPLALASYNAVLQMYGLFSGSISWLEPGAVESMVAFGPFHDLALDYAFLGLTFGLGVLAYALAVATTTAMMLAEPPDRWQLGPALRATFSRGLGIILAGILVMVIAAAVYWLQGAGLARQLRYDPSDPYNLGAAGSAVGLSLLLLILEIVGLYCVVRWCAALGALVIEGRSPRASLARSSELTRGRRRWIAGHLFITSLVVGVLVLIAAYIPAFVVGAALGAGSPVFAVFLAVSVVGVPILATPLALVVFAALFRDLRDAGPKPTAERVDGPGWGSSD